VSWLLVAFIPGLLMLATFGLDRLEASLEADTVSPDDVTAVLEQAKADCAKPATRPIDAYTYGSVDARYEERLLLEAPENLPTRVYVHHATNPEFRETRQPYRV